MLDNDELDNDALQARIDLSMAYANELVFSWIKPSLKSALTSRKETDKELEDYMRRPLRLGVGAPIPESASLSRETVRLKSRLTNGAGKKRVREGGAEGTRQSSDDEEESRAGAIKKKVKLDVFGGAVNGKKKRKAEKEIPTAQTASGSSETSKSAGVAKQGGTVRPDQKDTFDKPILPPVVSTPRKGKKNKFKRLRSEPNGLLRTPSPSASPALTATSGSVSGRKQERGELPQTPVKVPPLVKDSCSPGHSAAEVIDISLILASPSGFTSPLPAHVKTPQITAALRLPLLNLEGPPVIENPEGDASPKKKRRRRKKRKSSLPSTTMEEAV